MYLVTAVASHPVKCAAGTLSGAYKPLPRSWCMWEPEGLSISCGQTRRGSQNADISGTTCLPEYKVCVLQSIEVAQSFHRIATIIDAGASKWKCSTSRYWLNMTSRWPINCLSPAYGRQKYVCRSLAIDRPLHVQSPLFLATLKRFRSRVAFTDIVMASSRDWCFFWEATSRAFSNSHQSPAKCVWPSRVECKLVGLRCQHW